MGESYSETVASIQGEDSSVKGIALSPTEPAPYREGESLRGRHTIHLSRGCGTFTDASHTESDMVHTSQGRDSSPVIPLLASSTLLCAQSHILKGHSPTFPHICFSGSMYLSLLPPALSNNYSASNNANVQKKPCIYEGSRDLYKERI